MLIVGFPIQQRHTISFSWINNLLQQLPPNICHLSNFHSMTNMNDAGSMKTILFNFEVNHILTNGPLDSNLTLIN